MFIACKGRLILLISALLGIASKNVAYKIPENSENYKGWIKRFLPQEQGFKMKIYSINFLNQIYVFTYDV